MIESQDIDAVHTVPVNHRAADPVGGQHRVVVSELLL